MSTNDRPAQEAAGTYDEPLRPLPKRDYLGHDREGYCHHLDGDANIVTRFDDTSRIECRTNLGDRNRNDYLLFMAEEIGWRTRKQTGIFDLFAEAR